MKRPRIQYSIFVTGIIAFLLIVHASSSNAALPTNDNFASPSYSISAPSQTTIQQGSYGTIPITLSATNGYDGRVTLSVSSVTPAEPSITFVFSPPSTTVTGSTSVVMTATTTNATPCQSYSVKVHGTDTDNMEQDALTTVLVNCPENTDGSFTMHADDASETVTQGGSVSYGITVTPTGNYRGTVTLNTQGCPEASSCTYSDNGTVDFSSGTLTPKRVTLTVQTSAHGTTRAQSYSFSAMGTDGTNSATSDLSLNVTDQPSFSFTVSPNPLTVKAGSSASYTLTLTRLGGFSSSVTATWSSSAGSALTFSPASSVQFGSSDTSKTLTVSAAGDTNGKSYTINFTASGGGLQVNASNITANVNDTPACSDKSCADGYTCTTSGCQKPTISSTTCNANFCYDADGKFKTPAGDNCWATYPRCETFTVLKVQKDRICNQWLDCKSTVNVQDPTNASVIVPQCSALGVCIELGPDGTCSRFLDEHGKANRTFVSPDDVAGDASKIRWYSGYSSGFHLSSQKACSNDITHICTANADCGDNNYCNSILSSTYPATDISETGLNGANVVDVVPNGSFEQLQCLGGARDGKACITTSDCRVAEGRCTNQPEPVTPTIVSNVSCSSNTDCSDARAQDNTTPLSYCRYLSSWGSDVDCPNPKNSQWLGILPFNYHPDSDPSVEQAGFGYSTSDGGGYTSSLRDGTRLDNAGQAIVSWKVWEDENEATNFTDQTTKTSGKSPRFPFWSPTNHKADYNNVLKVVLDGSAPVGAGVGVPVSTQGTGLIAGGSGYVVSFKFRYAPASATPTPMKVQLGFGFQRDAVGGSAGYIQSSDGKEFVGTIDGTTNWQDIVFGPVTLTSTEVSSSTAFLEFISDAAGTTSTPTTFYLDDVSMKPALQPASSDTGPSPVLVSRSCRLFPNDGAPTCDYTDEQAITHRGWNGYCLDHDTQHPNLCLTWWPLDVLAGEGGLAAIGLPSYGQRAPLYQCLEQDGGAAVLDKTIPMGNNVSNEARMSWDPINGKYSVWRDGDLKVNNASLLLPANAKGFCAKDINQGFSGGGVRRSCNADADCNDPQQGDLGPCVTSEIPQGKIRWRDIERIDVLAWADDQNEENGAGSWKHCDSDGCIPGIDVTPNSYQHDSADGIVHAFTIRPDVINRVSTDSGVRMTFNHKNADVTTLDAAPFQNGNSDEVSAIFDVNNKKYLWNASCDDANPTDNKDAQYIAVRIHFNDINNPDADDAYVDKIQYKICDDRTDDIKYNQYVRVVIRAKQQCNYLVQTVKGGSGATEEKSWATRLQTSSRYSVPSLGLRFGSDAQPYGSVVGGTNFGDPSSWGVATSSGTGIGITSGLVVREPDVTGNALRAGTPFSIAKGFVPAQTKYCFDPAEPTITGKGGQQLAQFNVHDTNTCATSSQINQCNSYSNNSGACVGTPIGKCSGNTLWACSTNADCKGSNQGASYDYGTCDAGSVASYASTTNQGWQAGKSKVQHLFAAAYGCWQLQTTLGDSLACDKNGAVCTSSGSTSECGTDGGTCKPSGKKIQTSFVRCANESSVLWDVLKDGGVCTGPNGSRGGDNYCYVNPVIKNATLNSVSSGTITSPLYKQVSAQFQFDVDADQAPARAYQIFWGDNGDDNTTCNTTTPLANVVTTYQVNESHSYDVKGTYHPVACIRDNWGATTMQKLPPVCVGDTDTCRN